MSYERETITEEGVTCLIWNDRVLHEEHLQLGETDPEVSVSVLIGDVESQGSKLPPLQQCPVEQAEWEHEWFELVSLNIKTF